MIRSIYCPSSDKIDEAKILAKKFQLQILVGESEVTKMLEFDRKSVCVISIPNEHFLSLFHSTIKPNMAQVIEYTNDFCDFEKSDVVVMVDENVISPQVFEKHKSRYLHRASAPGIHFVRVFVNGSMTAEEKYEVLS